MSINADTEAGTTLDDVERLGEELGEAITALPEYEAFMDAKAAVEADEQVQEKIEEVEQLREDFMLARQIGEATQEDLDTFKSAQEELHSMPVMEEYLQSQQQLTQRLERVNEAISAPLALDFGEQAGGCCKD